MPACRRFAVHPAAEDRARERAVEAESFEDAALAFLEQWSPEAGAEGEDVALIVTDCENGRACCLRVDAGTGEAAPCD